MLHTLSRVLFGLVRRTWLVAVTTVAVCSLFAAQTVAAVVEARHLETSPQTTPLLQRAPVVPVFAPTPDGSALVERNMFCSSCSPSPDPRGPDRTDTFVPDAVLIATNIGVQPIATVRVPASEVQGDFGVGDTLFGIGTVTRIGFSSIDLRDTNGRIGTLSLRPSTDPGGRSVSAATPDPAAATSTDRARTPFADRIKKIDDTTFETDRELVRELMSTNGKNAGAKILPVTKDGKLGGLRLFGVQPNKLASSLGLKNGDVLEAINNTKIEDANTLLDMYAKLDTLDTVTFDGLRKGKPMTLTLRLR